MPTIPTLSTAQMHEVDRLMVEVYNIGRLPMMENAGHNLAQLAKRLLDDDIVDRPIVILAGRGRNGGSGLVAARHLINWGAWVQVLLSHRPEAFEGMARQQLEILQAMDVPLAWAEEGWELPPTDLVIDALIGDGLNGAPRGGAANLIQLANSSVAPILSLDAPSGLDTTSGTLYTPHVNATATLALALPKTGLIVPAVQRAVGQLYLADIGVPPALYEYLGLSVPPLFAADPILRLSVQEDRVTYP